MIFRRRLKNRHGFKKSLAILLVLCLLFLQSVFVYGWQSDNGDGTFNNPPLYADYPDPSMIRVGNYFYLATSTFVGVPGLVILKSEDLVNWEIAGHCISSFTGNKAYDLEGGTKYGNGCFAPSIAYKDGTFYVAVTPTVKEPASIMLRMWPVRGITTFLGAVILIPACSLMMTELLIWPTAELGKTK